MKKIINKKSINYIDRNIDNRNLTKNELLYYTGKLNEREYNINQKSKKIYFMQMNKINIFLMLLINILSLQLYLSKKNSFELRKINYLQRIKIFFIGKDRLYYLSYLSELPCPKYITVDNQNKDNFNRKYFTFEVNRTHNLTMEYDYEDEKIFSFKNLFSGMGHLTRVDFSEFNNKINDMTNMFKDCNLLEYVNFGNIDTSKVTSMEKMFYNTNLKFLDLSKFSTISVTNMNSMFEKSKNLLYLNLDSFETSQVTTMKNMFSNCDSLQFINLYTFIENNQLTTNDILYILIGTRNDLIYCINESNAPKITNELRTKTNPNSCSHACFQSPKKYIPQKKLCIDDCEQDGAYEIDNICYYIQEKTEEDSANSDNGDNDSENDSDNTSDNGAVSPNSEINTEGKTDSKYNEIMEGCSTEDFFKGLCNTDNKTLSTEKKDSIINNIVDNIINGNLNNLLNEIISGEKEDLFIKEDDVIFQITTTDHQNNNEYNNVSTINLGECEATLKQKYGIDPNDSLIILKIDYFMEGLMIPIIGYEVFHPKNKSKLNLDYCKDFLINYNIPVSINEDEISKHDPNSEYYNDECSTSTSEDGTDMTLIDRQKEYNDNNMSLCENKCNFTEYNTSSKKSVCMCEIKSKIYSISEILESKETVSKDFNTENITETSSSSSINLMKCYNTVFSKLGLLKNLGNYILLLMVIIFSVSSIFFYKVGYVLLENDIKKILLVKEKFEENINIYNYTQKKDIKEIKPKKKKKKKKSQKSSTHLSHPTRKSIRKSVEVIDLVNTGKDSNMHKSFSKLEFRESKKSNNINNINNIDNTPNKEKIQFNKIVNNVYTDYELNFFSYQEALEKDKRNIKQYYISLIRAKHPIIFSFVPITDYNSMIIKIDIFLIGFGIIYAMNALFFTESTIHQIYKDKGAYNLSYFLPKTFLPFFIAHIFVTGIKFIFLSERDILVVKNKETRNEASDQVDSVKKRLIIKYIIFYVTGVLFLILFWYYLSSFGAVYQNSQIILIINTFLSSAFSIIYPFFINFIPVIIRKFSLKNNNREIFYKASKIIQII